LHAADPFVLVALSLRSNRFQFWPLVLIPARFGHNTVGDLVDDGSMGMSVVVLKHVEASFVWLSGSKGGVRFRLRAGGNVSSYLNSCGGKRQEAENRNGKQYLHDPRKGYQGLKP
jgi:hypothetical protein